MFHSSTQRREWLFRDQREINEKRVVANCAYCSSHEAAAREGGAQLLSPEEEEIVVQYYLKKLVEFCSLFNPPSWAPLPKTALVRIPFSIQLANTQVAISCACS